MNCTKNWHEVYHTMEHPVHYIFVQNLYRFFIIGVGSQSTFKLGGHQIFARKICIKNEQNARILHDSSPKNARILCIIARKIFFPNFRGHVSPLPPPSPTPMFFIILLTSWDLSLVSRGNHKLVRLAISFPFKIFIHQKNW